MASKRKLRVAICHPDLGIGGAERLIVDAALELTSLGHHVHVFTAHHDPHRCFEETINGDSKGLPSRSGINFGHLHFSLPPCVNEQSFFVLPGSFPITVYGAFLPRHAFNMFHALFAYVRCLYVALSIILLWPAFDVVIVDQVSAVIPVLKLRKGAKVVFYCHFPDLLLAQHSTSLRKVYRWPIDWLEETTTGMADLVLVNSEFTAATFGKTFKSLDAKGLRPAVLYPAVDVHQFDQCIREDAGGSERLLEKLGLHPDMQILLSVNRFERKKNLQLAISAFSNLVKQRERREHGSQTEDVRLVVAGGYDPRLAENCEYFDELNTFAQDEGVGKDVIFLPSCSSTERNILLALCHCVIYTPTEEHFGIVPLEAMASGKPVIACNSGGPKESIKHGVTGLLCDPTPKSFSHAMSAVLMDPSKAAGMGTAARQHVLQKFSRETFGSRLDHFIMALKA